CLASCSLARHPGIRRVARAAAGAHPVLIRLGHGVPSPRQTPKWPPIIGTPWFVSTCACVAVQRIHLCMRRGASGDTPPSRAPRVPRRRVIQCRPTVVALPEKGARHAGLGSNFCRRLLLVWLA